MTETAAPRATGEAVGPDDELLLDRYLPRFDATQRQHLVVEADRETTWAAVERLDLMDVHTRLLDASMAVRGLPVRVSALLGRSRPPAPPEELRLFGDPTCPLPGWLRLGTRPGHEVALGAVGRFWQPDIDWYDTSAMSPDAFAGFAEPTWGRIAAGLSLRPYGRGRTLVTYEARTAVPDEASRRRFLRYWSLVGPFAGHVLRATLGALQDEAAEQDGVLRLP